MSRTYRKKKNDYGHWHDKAWALSETFWEEDLKDIDPADIACVKISYISPNHGPLYRVFFTSSSKLGKEKLAKWHSDSGVWDFKDPGPRWFKKLYTIRPERRKAKKEINKFLSDCDYEVQIHDKYYYEYWT